MTTHTIIKKGYGYVHNNHRVTLRIGDIVNQDTSGNLYLENGVQIPPFHAERIKKLIK